MSISVITPHYNDYDGLVRVYKCLLAQTQNSWQWVIVDDYSDTSIRQEIQDWHIDIKDDRVKLICNAQKSNASVCRNLGSNNAIYENLVFLDADDFISQDFILNRNINFNEFAVFKNIAVVDRNGTQEIKPNLNKNYLDCFLNAEFIWQTTAILWKKSFFLEIGKFDPNLQRLQDVELSIRALFEGKNYRIIDNKIDFFYNAKPIRLKTDIVRKSCASVNYLIWKIHTDYTLDAYRHSLIKSYYYACVKVLHRCKNREDVVYVKESLKLFYKKRFINANEYFIGKILLMLYQFRMISDSLFIRINRYFFK